MTELEQARARGERFRAWYERDGLREAFDHIRASYADRVTQLDPLDRDIGDKARILTTARKVVDQVEAAVVAIMAEGAVALDRIEHTKKLDALSKSKRRFL